MVQPFIPPWLPSDMKWSLTAGVQLIYARLLRVANGSFWHIPLVMDLNGSFCFYLSLEHRQSKQRPLRMTNRSDPRIHQGATKDVQTADI